MNLSKLVFKITVKTSSEIEQTKAGMLSWYRYHCGEKTKPSNPETLADIAGDIIFQGLYRGASLQGDHMYIDREESDATFRQMHPTPSRVREYGELRIKAKLVELMYPAAVANVRRQMNAGLL